MPSALHTRHPPRLTVLLRTWRSRAFWVHNALHVIPVALGMLFWWRVVVGVLQGTPPLLGWMISAYLSVWISVALNWQILRSPVPTAQLQRLAMLLLQFAVIIVANTIVIVLMLARGMHFRSADLFVLASAGVGLLVVGASILAGRLTPRSEWALCWYSVSLKSAPQLVQAAAIFAGVSQLDPWSSVFLLAQGASRWWISHEVSQKDPENSKKRAQLTNARWDVATVLLIALGVAHRVLG